MGSMRGVGQSIKQSVSQSVSRSLLACARSAREEMVLAACLPPIAIVTLPSIGHCNVGHCVLRR